MFLLRFRHVPMFRGRALSSSATSQAQVLHSKVVLDGQASYIERPIAEALGWSLRTGTEGVPFRVSGCEPKFFRITPTNTDAGMYFVLAGRPTSK